MFIILMSNYLDPSSSSSHSPRLPLLTSIHRLIDFIPLNSSSYNAHPSSSFPSSHYLYSFPSSSFSDNLHPSFSHNPHRPHNLDPLSSSLCSLNPHPSTTIIILFLLSSSSFSPTLFFFLLSLSKLLLTPRLVPFSPPPPFRGVFWFPSRSGVCRQRCPDDWRWTRESTETIAGGTARAGKESFVHHYALHTAITISRTANCCRRTALSGGKDISMFSHFFRIAQPLL